jgi:hypothetical protein
MPNTSVKVAIALFMVLTPPAASFCARRTWRRTRRFGGNGRICATRRFGGNGECADQWYSARPGKRRWIEQRDGRSQRGGQRFQDSAAAAAPHGRLDAAGWYAKSGRTSVDELKPASAAGGTGGRGAPAARRSSAIGEQPEESERSHQSGERGARPHDQWHLSRVLSNGLFP